MAETVIERAKFLGAKSARLAEEIRDLQSRTRTLRWEIFKGALCSEEEFAALLRLIVERKIGAPSELGRIPIYLSHDPAGFRIPGEPRCRARAGSIEVDPDLTPEELILELTRPLASPEDQAQQDALNATPAPATN